MADAAAQRHQQLKNEANKMAMKIPISHGDDKEDSLNIKEIIRRFENSADTMRVANQVEKWKMFSNSMRGLAMFNWESKDFFGLDRYVWQMVNYYYL